MIWLLENIKDIMLLTFIILIIQLTLFIIAFKAGWLVTIIRKIVAKPKAK